VRGPGWSTDGHRARRYPAGGWEPISVDEHTIVVAGVPVFYQEAPGAGVPVLYLHDAVTSSDDWLDFLRTAGGIAPDLLGFGRSAKGGNLDFTLTGLIDFLERLLPELDLHRFCLVGHGWGAAVGLGFAQRHPERIERLVLCDAVPLLDSFDWFRLARAWRTPLVGELAMGSTNRWVLARLLRSACAGPEAFSDARIGSIWEQFDQGTQRAILRLYRGNDAAGLAAAGAELGELHCPALVVWGERDPWLDIRFGDAYATRLPNATLARIQDAGHWPWLDQPEVIKRITDFVGAEPG
jgi:pimeloyl-ACP methyl ester carboxylesterase